MDTNTAPSDGARPHGLLAWRWLIAALVLLVVATIVAWGQQPRPVPPLRGQQAWSFLHPGESNPHRRLVSVLDNLHWVEFEANNLRGWTVGDNGLVLFTDDGGGNWSKQDGTSAQGRAVLQRAALEVAGVRRFDPPRAWGSIIQPNHVGQPPLGAYPGISPNLNVQKSPFGGSPAISPAPIGAGTLFTTVRLDAGKQYGWALGDDGTIHSTDDGGKKWTRQASGAGQRLNYVHFSTDLLHGWAVGESGTIIHTADGGKTWSPQSSTSQPALNDIWVTANGQRAWAVGAGGTVITTFDRGRTWQAQTSGVPAKLLAVTFAPDGLHGWATGESGTIIATADAGRNWTKQTSGSIAAIAAISFAESAQIGWALDYDGKKFLTADGGATWRPATTGQALRMSSVGFSAAAKRGWGIGSPSTLDPSLFGGRLYTTSNSNGEAWTLLPSKWSLRSVSYDPKGTRILAICAPKAPGDPADGLYATDVPVSSFDGGLSWQTQQSNVARGLHAVKLGADGQSAWAVGKGGRIVVSDDSGQHWRDAEQYSRSPAPWYWLAVIVSSMLAGIAWRNRPAAQSKESVADVAASDAEVRLPADDRLNFSGLARGISRFLRNAETQPPLTMAITGDWGSGKSSLMQLVCADLRRFGHRPIWFNAWHHQKQEHLFAALLGAIYAQAVPPLLSLNGIAFRLRLLWLRSWKHFGVMMTVVAAVTTLSILSWQAFEAGGLHNLASSVAAMRELAAPRLASATALLAALTAWYTLFKGTTAFGVNPALLLSATRDRMSLKGAAAQNDFRDRFARQFDELTKALPYRLVIVIDDLDRCHPSAVIDVMEAVNYLTSAGKCFVMFGMARERVQAALGLAFKDIAAEMAQLDEAAPSASDGTTDSARERAKRRAYAADYLQKLVNIEIQVPASHSDANHRLLLAPAPVPRSRTRDSLATIVRLWPLIAAACALALGVWLASAVGELAGAAAPPAPPGVASATVPAPVAAAPAASAGSEGATASPANGGAGRYEVHAGEPASLTQRLGWLLLGFSPLLAIGVAIAVLLMRKNLYETRDSERFGEALEIWTRVVANKRATPRAIKRFGNRLRYLAMLQQGEQKDETVLDLLEEKLRKRFHRGRSDASSDIARESSLFEHQLIALGALHEVWGEQWKEKIATTFPDGWRRSADAVTSGNDAASVARNAAAAHQRQFGTAWPPSASEVETFERLIAGVRLAGDPQPIEPETAPRPSSKSSYA